MNEIEQKAVRKDGDVTMCDLLNKEIEELTNQKEIEEMAKDLKNCLPSDWFWLKTVDADAYLVAKHFYNLGYQNCQDKVVLDKEEHIALINEFNALQHKYNDICDRYRLCKDENETIKQYAVMTRQETAKEIIEMLVPPCEACDENWHKGCLCLRTTIAEKIAKQYGVEVE